jgi:hypothetical protein
MNLSHKRRSRAAEEGPVQASRGKNYVEEEKRLLRGSGVYCFF